MLAIKKAFVHKLLIAASPSASFATAKCNPKSEPFPGGFQAFTTGNFATWCKNANNGIPLTFLQLSNVVMSDYNAAYAFNQALFDEVAKKLPHGVDENFQLYESAGSMKQHLYLVGSRIQMGVNVQELFERGLLFPVYIASIHPDTFMFDPQSRIGKALKEEGQNFCTRTNYIRENRKDINANNDIIIEEIIKNKGNITAGLSVYINGNIIDVAQFKQTKLKNGKVRVTFQAMTWAKEHSLSGQATHCFEFDPNFPDEILYLVWGSREGWLIADMTNGPISSILWKAVADTIASMYASMKESGAFGTAAREKAWSGLVCRLWTKSRWAATRRFLASTFMCFTTPVGVEIKRRITDSTYNKGALVQYVPIDITKWEKEYQLVPGNLTDLGAYDWDSITLEAMSAMADPTKLDESKPMAEDTLGGAIFLGHLVNGTALMQPSYTLAMTDLAMSKLSKDDLDVIKKAYENVVLANLKTPSNTTPVTSGPWKGTGTVVRQYWAWAALSPYRVELEKVAAIQVGSKATRSEISEYIDALHAEKAVLPKGDLPV